ncbi:MAG: TVP38/TMEM64 family protein [Bacilli bacterium]
MMDWINNMPDMLANNIGSLFVIGFLIVALEAFLPFLPLTAFVAWNGFALGVVNGFIVSLVAAGLSSFVIYLTVRHFSHRVPAKWRSERVQTWVRRQSFVTLSIAYALPVVPHSAITLALGVFGVRKRVAFTSIFLGKGVQFAFLSFFGGQLEQCLMNPFFYLSAALLVGLVYFLNKKIGFDAEAVPAS